MDISVLAPPGAPLPDLRTIDFNDASSRVEWILRVNIIFISLVSLIVAARIFVRVYLLKKLFVDDILAIIGAFLTVSLSIVCIIATHFGLGKHVWNLDLNNITAEFATIIQLLFTCYIIYAFATAFTKLSIIATYMRVFVHPFSRIVIKFTAVFNGLLCIASVLVTVFQCSPVRAAWDYLVPNRKCIEFVNFLYAICACNIFIDVILVVVAVPHLWKLRVPIRQKIIVCILFCMGGMACIASIIRITKVNVLRGFDISYETAVSLNWSVIECALGIICISIPPLRPAALKILPPSLLSSQFSDMEPHYLNMRLQHVDLETQAGADNSSNPNNIPPNPRHSTRSSRQTGSSEHSTTQGSSLAKSFC